MPKKPIIKMYCPTCKTEPKKDESKSNKNWETFSNTCEGCGGRLKLKVL